MIAGCVTTQMQTQMQTQTQTQTHMRGKYEHTGPLGPEQDGNDNGSRHGRQAALFSAYPG